MRYSPWWMFLSIAVLEPGPPKSDVLDEPLWDLCEGSEFHLLMVGFHVIKVLIGLTFSSWPLIFKSTYNANKFTFFALSIFHTFLEGSWFRGWGELRGGKGCDLILQDNLVFRYEYLNEWMSTVLYGLTQLKIQDHWPSFLCPEALGQAQCLSSWYLLGPHPVPAEQSQDW